MYIFCLMGKSASGKDSIYQRLLAREELCLKRVIPYTTRPMREGETDAETYFFCSNEKVAELQQQGKIIELRGYYTVHGLWQYFTADDGQICLDEHNYLMIGTIEAYVKLKEYFGSESVVPLFIDLDDGMRLQRALDRERAQAEPKYAEMCRRFLADEEDFSPEKIEGAGIETVFVNDRLEDTVEHLVQYIKNYS